MLRQILTTNINQRKNSAERRIFLILGLFGRIYSIPTTDEYGENTGRHHDIRIIRRYKNDGFQYWNKLFEFSQKHPEKNLDELIILRNKDRKSSNGHF